MASHDTDRVKREWTFEELQDEFRKKKLGYEIAEHFRVKDLRAETHESWLKTLRFVWSVREPDQKFFETALVVQRALQSKGITFCFIGGLAQQRWGEVRVTRDIDLTILCPPGEEARTLEQLKELVPPRPDYDESLAPISRMYLGVAQNGIRVDMSLGFIPYEERIQERAVDVDFGLSEPLRCCSAEDLAVLKTVAGRPQDWNDIMRICHRSGAAVNWVLVYTELEILLNLAEKPENLNRLKEYVEKYVE